MTTFRLISKLLNSNRILNLPISSVIKVDSPSSSIAQFLKAGGVREEPLLKTIIGEEEAESLCYVPTGNARRNIGEAIVGTSTWPKIYPTTSGSLASKREVSLGSCTMRLGGSHGLFPTLIRANDKRSNCGDASRIPSSSSSSMATSAVQNQNWRWSSLSPVKQLDDQGSVEL
jgi:hypothetical protein